MSEPAMDAVEGKAWFWRVTLNGDSTHMYGSGNFSTVIADGDATSTIDIVENDNTSVSVSNTCTGSCSLNSFVIVHN